jgi:hypothetical protein
MMVVMPTKLVEVYERPNRPFCYKVAKFCAPGFVEALLTSPFEVVWRSSSIDLSYQDPMPFELLNKGNLQNLIESFESRDRFNYPDPEVAEFLGRKYVEAFVLQSSRPQDDLRAELKAFDRGEPSALKLVALQISDDAHVYLYAPPEPEPSLRRVLEAAGVNIGFRLKRRRYWWLHSLELERHFGLNQQD